MSHAVNLLPESCDNARLRSVRRNAWTVVVLLAGLLVTGTWVALHATGRVLVRLNGELAGLQAKQFELDRQVTLAVKLRNDLALRGRALTALRQEHPLPQQLLTLTRLAPGGIVLTELRAQPTGRPAAATPPPAKRPDAAPAKAQPVPAVQRPPPVVVEMSGYAVDHDELMRLIDVVRQVPRWKQVELLRAAREPFLQSVAIAFRLECRDREAAP